MAKTHTPTATPASDWKYVAEDAGDELQSVKLPPKANTSSKPVKWSFAQKADSSKSVGWYFKLLLVTLVVAFIVLFLTKDKITTVVVLFAGLAIGFYATHKPRPLDYELDSSGVNIGPRFYELNAFKSFSIADDLNHKSLLLVPLKRFYPILTLYFHPKDEKAILTVLSDKLPQEERGNDLIDRFLNYIKY